VAELGPGARKWMGVTVGIAYCPEHGLHGLRDTCFECGGPVEHIAMRPVEREAEQVVRALLQALEGLGYNSPKLNRAIARAIRWLPS
jgi:hypothetical protein